MPYYGFYSAQAVRVCGSSIYSTPDGGEVEVNFVDSDPTGAVNRWEDKVPRGEVLVRLREGKPNPNRLSELCWVLDVAPASYTEEDFDKDLLYLNQEMGDLDHEAEDQFNGSEPTSFLEAVLSMYPDIELDG